HRVLSEVSVISWFFMPMCQSNLRKLVKLHLRCYFKIATTCEQSYKLRFETAEIAMRRNLRSVFGKAAARRFPLPVSLAYRRPCAFTACSSSATLVQLPEQE